MSFFFLDLMNKGLPLQSPTAVVDLDNTPLSRRVVRNLDTSELVDIQYRPSSYGDAMKLLKEGTVYGFFMIPRNFQTDAEGGRPTTITYYCNMAYFIPGTLSFKGFKTTAVSTSGAIAMTTLVSAGVDGELVNNLLQPVVTQEHPIGNPWLNYSIYLSNSFLPCLLQLIIFQITAFSILQEIKLGTSIKWVNDAGQSIVIALFGKLMPQFIIFTSVGLAMQSLIYFYWGVEHDMGHGAAGDCFTGVCADDNKPDTQPEVRIVDSVACGHPVVLDSCLLIPCREHVSGGGHILLHSSYTLLLPHIYKCGA